MPGGGDPDRAGSRRLRHSVPGLRAVLGGGALDTASYEAWIDGFAAGIGKRKAVVVLEPDSLGIIPWSGDWCQPTVTDAAGNTTPAPGADPATRYLQLNYAVDKLAAAAPNALSTWTAPTAAG